MKSVDVSKTPAAQVALHFHNMKLAVHLLQCMEKETSFLQKHMRLARIALTQTSNLNRFPTQYECPSK
jgi:hypothetical protein